MRPWLLSVSVLCGTAPAAAMTLHVPTADFPTVQAAIDSAAAGDTLQLAPHVFEENPLILEKDLVIRSGPGGRATIDAAKHAGENGNTGSALRSIRAQIVLEDLVLRNATAVPVGAGVWVWGGRVEMRRCRFENNDYGVLVFDPNPGATLLEDCEFVGNGAGLWSFLDTEVRRCRFENNWLAIRCIGNVTMSDVEVTGSGTEWGVIEPPFAPASLLLPGAQGLLERVRVHHNLVGQGLAGMWIEEGPFELVECESTDNQSSLGPSGLAAIRVASMTLRKCTLRANHSRGSAFPVGGLFADRSQVRAEGCRFEANDSGDRGSGVAAIRNSRVELFGGSVLENKVRSAGGGIYASASHVLLDSVLVAGNSAQGGGGIALDPGGSVHLQRCTVVGNSAGGGGALLAVQATATLENSIVAFNTGSPVVICAGQVSRRCTDVFGNSDAGACGIDLGGNLSVDPEFCDYDPARGAYDLRIAAASPLALAGDCGRIGSAGIGCAGTAARAATGSDVKRLYR